MQTTLTELDFLLDCVGPMHVGAGARSSALRDDQRPKSDALLLDCAAEWSTRATTKKASVAGPNHQTLRYRGQAPSYHRPIDLTRGVPGRLAMYADRLVLKPSSAEAAETTITADSIRRVSFYADCIEIIYGNDEQTLLCTDAIELLDLKFEVYYGRQLGIGFNGH